MTLRYTLKTLMLCATMSSAMVAPMPAMAENIYVMVVNTRGEDGIYRPALRVIRGGTVVYYSSQNTTLTANILQDQGALSDWLAQNAGLTAEEAGSAIVEVVQSAQPQGESINHGCPDNTTPVVENGVVTGCKFNS